MSIYQTPTFFFCSARGVTVSGGVTKWSEKSEMMATLADEHGHEAWASSNGKNNKKKRDFRLKTQRFLV